jgi:peptidoglycan hydrolase CwlO-like protein
MVLMVFSLIYSRVDADRATSELRSAIDALTNQIGNYEGEITTLSGRTENQEYEIRKLKELIAKLQADNTRLRNVSVLTTMPNFRSEQILKLISLISLTL